MNKEIQRKSGKFVSFYFFLMYLYTSMPSLQMNMMSLSNLCYFVLRYGFTILSAIKCKVNFYNKKLGIVLLIILVWYLAQSIIHKSFFKFSPFIILEVLSSFIIIQIYRQSIFKRFEEVTYVLCIIALIGWGLSLIFNPLIKTLANIAGFEGNREWTICLYVYTVNMLDGLRNCGFAWEPGRTSCMACVGLLFYLMRTKCNIKTLRFWIMTACIISTFSTTGFCVFLVIFIICYNSFHRINVIHIFFMSLLVVGVMSLPFMGEKIGFWMNEGTGERMESISESLDWEASNKDSDRDYYVPQRFQGLMFSIINLRNTNYFIGDGRDFTQFYINRINNWKVKTSEGVLEPIVQFGLLISILMYYLLYMASKRISDLYNLKNKWLYFIVFLMINISYNFWETPLYMSIWMLPFYSKYNYGKTTITVNSNSMLQQ